MHRYRFDEHRVKKFNYQVKCGFCRVTFTTVEPSRKYCDWCKTRKFTKEE